MEYCRGISLVYRIPVRIRSDEETVYIICGDCFLAFNEKLLSKLRENTSRVVSWYPLGGDARTCMEDYTRRRLGESYRL